MKKRFYPGAPASSDQLIVNQLFRHYCNCYSYAVQDYFAGHLTGLSGIQRSGYLPRPGQTRGKSYTDLKGKNIRGMRRAICEDGLLFAGEKYPQRVPDDKYVICCFLEPGQYHFIRQNQDGSWSSKNGPNEVTFLDSKQEPLTDPENFYHKDPTCSFVGYFFVPKGGIRVGVRAYEEKKLAELEKRSLKHPVQKKLRDFLRRSVQVTHESDEIKKKAFEMWTKNPKDLLHLWNGYIQDICALALFLKRGGFQRPSLLKLARTRGKKDRSD